MAAKRPKPNKDAPPVVLVRCGSSWLLRLGCKPPRLEGSKDVKQLQEDLPQEKADNAVEPNKKKDALKGIIADYNDQFGANHSISEFDLYYQDVQKRIKDQQFPNQDLYHSRWSRKSNRKSK